LEARLDGFHATNVQQFCVESSGVLVWDVGAGIRLLTKEVFGILPSGNKLPAIPEDFCAALADD
jgi:hypothetical protein